jgi:hypothetical protein
MWKKVNLADSKNLAAVAGQCCQILVEKKKKEKSFPFNKLASLNLNFRKKIAKKGKKSRKANYGNHPITSPKQKNGHLNTYPPKI